ncbi:MAG: DUF4364 family protein, partial [Clostridia bacterium]|nr:DUF4364 family protein [Clostridia bacterium]
DGTRVLSDIKPCGEGYNITCTIANSTKTVLNVELYVTEERYAHQLIGNFEDNAENVYKGIMALLSGDVNYIFND